MATESGLQFTLTVEGLSDDTFSVIEFTGESKLSSPYLFQVKLASRHASISEFDTVDRNVTLKLWNHGVLEQRFHGVIRQFTRGDTGFSHTRYTLEFVPALSRLSLRQNSRIFQQQTVPEIISLLLQEMGIDDFAFSISGSPQVREYCVQYRETDLEFIERLAAEEGIFYCFLHEKDKHTVLFSDDTQTLSHSDLSLLYNAKAGGVSAVPFIKGWEYAVQTRPSSAVLKDYSFKKPAYGFLHEKAGNEMGYQRGEYEHYDYPGRYKSDAAGKPFTQYRLEHLRSDAFVASAASNVFQINAGLLFDLQDHEDDASNRDWIVVNMRCEGTQPQALEEYGGEGMTTFHNHFSVIPGHRPWRPAPRPKPCVQGPQIAIVTGPSGEEIFCDEYGRVKVQFPWDRYGNHDEVSSCWVRVSQGWAGGQYGMVAIPRIGHEVIVSFLEGDPDQPIITGRTYHATNVPPYPLPANKTRTVIRTDTHKGKGSNEIRFEDEADKEEIYVHAQKDQNIVVENNETTTVMVNRSENVGNNEDVSIGNNKTVSVTKDHFEQVGRDKHKKVLRNEIINITKDHIQNVGNIQRDNIYADHQYIVGGHFKGEIAGTQTLNVGDKITHNTRLHELMAFEKFVIKGPGGKITLDASGITMEGAVINLKGNVNMGGSGSSQVPSLSMAANSAKPIAEECPSPESEE